MTDPEWEDIVAMLRHWWPGDFSEATSEGYRMLLDAYPAAEVAGAVGTIVDAQTAKGTRERFRPSAVDVLAQLRAAKPVASPDEAMALIEQAQRKVNCSIYDPAFDERHQAAIDWLAEQDVIVAAFAARRGLVQIEGSLGQEPVNDPRYGGAVRARIRKDFGEHLQLCVERLERGLPAVEGKPLVRLSSGVQQSGGMRELVESLRPEDVRELEAGAREIEESNDGEA